jgi:tetratricopeptide (TPR) repeat protein
LPTQWPEVARLIPDQRLAVPVPPTAQLGSGSADDQQRLFWQVTRFLETLSDERPLALLVDDLHWMDGASFQLLLHLARNTRESPILLLGTYRDSEVPMSHPLAAGLRDLGRAQLVERMELYPLPREGTAALLAATLEDGEVSEAVTNVIYGPTEGNAFFVQEVLHALIERGDITLQSGSWQPRPGTDILVPESIRAAVLERVGRLSPTAQETLGIASVLGQTFRFDDLLATWTVLTLPPTSAMATGESHGVVTIGTTTEQESTLEAAVEEALRARVVREVGGERYAFSHALAQQALYEQLSVRRRHRLHRAAAESLEQLAQPERARRASDIAYHFLQADSPARALQYVLQAGQQALSVYAYPEAELQFRMAVDLARRCSDLEAECVAGEQLSMALEWQIRFDEAFSVLQAAISEAELRGDLVHLARLAYRQNSVPSSLGASPELIARLLRLIETTEAQGASPELARLHLTLRGSYYKTGQYAEEMVTTEHALEVSQAVEDAGLVAEARAWRGGVLGNVGRLEEALLELRTALPVLETRDDLKSQDLFRWTLHRLGIVLRQLGRLGEAEAHFARALEVAEQSRDLVSVAWASAECGLTAFLRGDCSAARIHVERAVALRPHLDNSFWSDASVYQAEAHLQLALGQLDLAIRSAEAELAFAEHTANELIASRDAQQVLAELDLLKGDPAAARARLLPLLDRPGLVELAVNGLLPLLIWAHLELGEVQAAEMLATQTITRLRAQHDLLNLVNALRVEASIRIRQKDWGKAEVALGEALPLTRHMPYPYAEAKALSTYGDLLVAHGQPERARDQYEAALTILRSLGERPYAERIERALVEMRQQ